MPHAQNPISEDPTPVDETPTFVTDATLELRNSLKDSFEKEYWNASKTGKRNISFIFLTTEILVDKKR